MKEISLEIFMEKEYVMSVVNIIIPVYNTRKTLKKCIESLKNQTFKDIEILLIDDGSTDGSDKICDEFAKKDSRIRVVHKNNGGAISARNVGIELISEEGYTTFCDADDLMPKNGIEKLYQLAVENNADIASGTLQRFLKRTFFFKVKKQIPASLSKKQVYKGEQVKEIVMPSFFGITDFPGYMPTKLYKNTLLKKSQFFECPAKHFQEDIAFNLQMCILAECIAVMPDTVYYYRMGGGTSRFMPTFMEDCINLYKIKIKQIDKNGFSPELKITSAIEMKNELWTWMNMYFQEYKKSKPLSEIKKEIKRCCELQLIQEALSYKENEQFGVKNFGELVKENNADEILELLQLHDKQIRLKSIIKRIIMNL